MSKSLEKKHSNIVSELQTEIESIYLQRLQWIQQLKKDLVHKKNYANKVCARDPWRF